MRRTLRSSMSAWRLHSYDGIGTLKFEQKLSLPVLRDAGEVLVKVRAASVNPLDIVMTEGFGNAALNCTASAIAGGKRHDRLPLILGRDFSGIVEDVGRNVTSLKPGDEVWGAVGPERPGSHAEFVALPSCSVTKKPQNLSHTEAASLPYAALTAWSALETCAGIKGPSRVLVLGASGGVGSAAIQILKAWNCEVIGTCSEESLDMVKRLGANEVLNYRDPDILSKLQQIPRFDAVIDCTPMGASTLGYENLISGKHGSRFVTLSSPLLPNIDKSGVLMGGIQSLATLLKENLTKKYIGTYGWGLFLPNPKALKTLKDFAELQIIKPVVHCQFSFSKLDRAFCEVQAGRICGKIVIDIDKEGALEN